MDTRSRRCRAAFADFGVVRLLGEGNHGRFYLARPPARLGLDDEFVAVKVFGDRVSEHAYDRGTRELRAFAAVARRTWPGSTTPCSRTPSSTRWSTSRSARWPRPARPLTRASAARLEHAARAAHALHEAGWRTATSSPATCCSRARRDRRPALRPRPGPVPHARHHADRHGPGQLGGVPRPGLLGRRAPVAAHRDLGAGRHPAPRAVRHRALRRTARTQPLLAIRRVLGAQPQIDPALRPDEAAFVRDCLAARRRRLPTAEAVADRLAALRT